MTNLKPTAMFNSILKIFVIGSTISEMSEDGYDHGRHLHTQSFA